MPLLCLVWQLIFRAICDCRHGPLNMIEQSESHRMSLQLNYVFTCVSRELGSPAV